MKSYSVVAKDISLDLNILHLQMKFEEPIPETLIIQWERGK